MGCIPCDIRSSPELLVTYYTLTVEIPTGTTQDYSGSHPVIARAGKGAIING